VEERGGKAAGVAEGAVSDRSTSSGALRLKDLQGVFASSLVSRASLDFLAVASLADDDYADVRYSAHRSLTIPSL
jgi:hypothetical protein